MPLLDSPKVELVVYRHGGRWVDANGNEVDNATAKRARIQMKHHLENPVQPNVELFTDDDLEDDDEDVEDDDEDDGTEEVDYSSMTNDELRAEIATRNDSRPADSQLSLEGKKAGLIATLEGDDDSRE